MKKYGFDQTWIEFKTELKHPTKTNTSSQTFSLNLQLVPQSLWKWQMKLDVISSTWCKDKFREQRGNTYDTIFNHVSSGVDTRHPWSGLLQRIIESLTITASIVNGGTVRSTISKPKLCLIWWPSTKNGHFDGLKVCILGTWSLTVAKSNMQIFETFGATLYFAGQTNGEVEFELWNLRIWSGARKNVRKR